MTRAPVGFRWRIALDSFIRDRQRAAQIVDFGGLRWGLCMPTDVDAILDFSGLVWVIIEAKYKESEPPTGQRLALERMTDQLGQNAYAICLLATHESEGDVLLHECRVFRYRRSGEWRIPDRRITVKEAIDDYLRMVGPQELLERLGL